ASFAGAGVAGANPMQTAFVSWKLAKGLYIIPIVMAYRPLLGVGQKYSLMSWDVVLTIATTLCGLIAFAGVLERYFLRRMTWLETFLMALVAAVLFWPLPSLVWDVVALAAFGGLIVFQKRYTPKNLAPLPGEVSGLT
ncbi:MAG: hypothetical protein JRJ59_00680, partial [Deltaproteobacteria bacterium]|nr:hypothetical protein [Deltaproteobacteria bacterium]